MSQEKTILLVGGPDSGKTNYLGRLWLAIREGKARMQTNGMPSDLEYLNHVASYFLQGQFAPHTSQETRNKVSIPVQVESSSNMTRSTLVVPDVSGEAWMKIYQKRGWSEEWEQDVDNITGCLIFIRVDSDSIIPAIDWISWSTLPDMERANFEIPTQVVLVDWLQCLQSVFLQNGVRTSRPRVSIVVSAYDLLPDEQKPLGPENFIQTNFPLFWQYTKSMNDQFNFRLFGTSIAGGDFFADPKFRTNFLRAKPLDAGSVIFHTENGIEESNDITLPVIWAMGIELDSVAER